MPASATLRSRDKRIITVLGLPTFALALAITIVSTYLPPVARGFTSSDTVIGILIGGEGLFALFLPVFVGVWSDHLETPIGPRLPFLLAGVPVLAAALVVLGFVGSLGGLAVMVAIFFAAYFVAYEPYRALYPDLLSDEVAGRAQSAQAVWRGAGTALALVGGGLLLSVARILPFAVTAAITLVTCGIFLAFALQRRRGGDRVEAGRRRRHPYRRLYGVLRGDRRLQALLVANSLWELSLAALKTFVVLYVSVGLGHSISTASLAIGATALVILAAAAVSGPLGDRFGKRRLMAIALWVYAVGLLVPFVTTTLWLLVPAVPLIAFGGGVVMSLPYAILMPMMPSDEHGAVTGLYSLSRGVGVMAGPVLGGVAIDAFKGTLSGTHGYQAVWLVCAAAVAASIPLLHLTRTRAGA